MEIAFFIIAFLAGFLVKVVDWMDDEKKTLVVIKLPLAIAYGVLIGLLISQAIFGLLFLGALLAQILARKIDTLSHRVGFFIAILTIVYFGFPNIEIIPLLYFMILAFLDEEDYIGKWRPLFEYRPFLKVGAFLLFFLGRYDYFLGIIMFDIGYELFSLVSKGIKAKKEKTKYGRVGVRSKVSIQRKR